MKNVYNMKLAIQYNCDFSPTGGFPGSSVGKESACNVGDPGLIVGWERSPGEGNGYPLRYSCLEDPLDRGSWRVIMGLQRVGHD